MESASSKIEARRGEKGGEGKVEREEEAMGGGWKGEKGGDARRGEGGEEAREEERGEEAREKRGEVREEKRGGECRARDWWWRVTG